MENRHLRYFLAIADTGSITRAAEHLGIAQPALSQALVRMENELGVKLFERSRRGAVLTPAATAIIDDIRVSLARIDAATQRARAIGAKRAGRLIIGFVSTALFGALPRALDRMQANYPGVEVVLREMSNAEQGLALQRGEIDIGLLHTPVSIQGNMREKLISQDPLIAVLPSGYALGEDGKVGMEQLAATGLVWFPEQQLPLIRNAIVGTFRRLGHPIEIIQEANRTLTVVAYVAAGRGVSLLPATVQALQFEGMKYSEIRDGADLPHFELSAIWPAQSKPTMADRFAELLFAR
ncbi:LysR family transcriptional regulator [Pseudomonas sp. NPDC087612]|uniref:LysR family transcriptional regulator n=1 Tax=Pseudomonas TaxID=286 RepID=UPI0005EB6F93|nr:MULTISPECIES: LysR family transcriptional regulator [unclassified Pseudomonas]KJK16791.1 LysR family transcriptional regulator [Pseudomonas sp. 2(2015)]QPG61837.1 LysR family transcriptional regulator [Pseudomonas sp. BIGb0427]UVL58811.1 LysR family transcriptional regulator [Pseudomonas sp. B21-035]UVL64135.1 LysR family transcriptional regulator [Pseudomonas sp. B21-032]UVM58437.1 LysR family transcriptional regulator [Pseudomonas sp. B21-012]